MTALTPEQAREYDDFSGPDLDSEKWMYLQYPLPDGSTHVCSEPSSTTTVRDGALKVHIEKFENFHGVQIIDNPKHLLFSTQAFEIPASGECCFSVTMTGQGINTVPFDYRDGFAAFNLLDLSGGWVFDLAVSTDTVFAIHERLPLPGVEQSFTHCVNAPLAGLDTSAGAEHRCTVSLDRGAGTAAWIVDGTTVYEISGAVIPERVQVGFGVFTLQQVQNDTSVSLHGQGFDASWKDVVIDLVGTA